MILAHKKLAVGLIVLGLAGALWGLWGWRRNGMIAPGLRAFLLLCEALVLIQDLRALLSPGDAAALDHALPNRGGRPP